MKYSSGLVTMLFKRKCRAAGIIICRKIDNNYELLGLEALEHHQIRSNGIYDIPKGKIDSGETPEECSIRECWEEVGIEVHDFIAGPNKSEGLWLWLAITNKEPILGINPHTQLPEHLGYKWLSPDTLTNECLNYLKNGINWAKKTLEQDYDCK